MLISEPTVSLQEAKRREEKNARIPIAIEESQSSSQELFKWS